MRQAWCSYKQLSSGCVRQAQRNVNKKLSIIWARQLYYREFCNFFPEVDADYRDGLCCISVFHWDQKSTGFERNRLTSSWAEWPFIAGRPGIFSWYYSLLNTLKKSSWCPIWLCTWTPSACLRHNYEVLMLHTSPRLLVQRPPCEKGAISGCDCVSPDRIQPTIPRFFCH